MLYISLILISLLTSDYSPAMSPPTSLSTVLVMDCNIIILQQTKLWQKYHSVIFIGRQHTVAIMIWDFCPSVWTSVRLSICLSVQLWCCVETAVVYIVTLFQHLVKINNCKQFVYMVVVKHSSLHAKFDRSSWATLRNRWSPYWTTVVELA